MPQLFGSFYSQSVVSDYRCHAQYAEKAKTEPALLES